jgi:hypothetical protein
MPCYVTPGGLAPPAAISCEPSFGTGVLATDRARGAAGSTGLAAGAAAGGVGAGAGEGALVLKAYLGVQQDFELVGQIVTSPPEIPC